ncbi:hypothetical protein BH23GEM9_BH23GEM9_25910 [soil metagenome]
MRIMLLKGASLLALSVTGCATVGTTVVPITKTAAAADTTYPRPQHTTPIMPLPGRVMNPLFQPWAGPNGGVPPWDLVHPELFPEAFQAGINARRVEIQAIANNPEAPTFANTFAPLQNAGRLLGRVNVLFGVMTSNVNTPAYQALDREWSPRRAAAADEITFNEQLFRRIEAVYNNRDRADLSAEQRRLVERTYQQYVRAGARLTAAEKTR